MNIRGIFLESYALGLGSRGLIALFAKAPRIAGLVPVNETESH